MKYLSVCSGIEAASVAWHPLGWTPIGFSEIEPFPGAVLAHHFPTTPNFGDMTQHEHWPIEPGSIDILVGGTPCQSFSVAGLRQGLKDPRGNLMLTYLAIAARLRPRWILWENVFGVLSSNRGRDFGSFVGALGQLGYGWAYRILDAQWIRTQRHPRAVPQRRRRVFVVGCLGDERRAAQVLFESESVCRNPSSRRATRQGVAADVEEGVGSGGEVNICQMINDGIPDVCATIDCGLAKQVGEQLTQQAECFYFPTVATVDARNNFDRGDSQHLDRPIPCWWDGDNTASTLTKSNANGAQRMPDKDNFGAVLQPVPFVKAKRAQSTTDNETWVEGAVAPTQNAFDVGDVRATTVVIPIMPQAMQSEGWRVGKENQDGRGNGLGVGKDGDPCLTLDRSAVPAVAIQGTVIGRQDHNGPQGSGCSDRGEMLALDSTDVHAVAVALTSFDCKGSHINVDRNGVAQTLRSMSHAGSHANGGVQIAIASQTMQVRRLTPTECERLQGFPDGWTAIPYRGKSADQCPDGPRYKALGNSMATNCMEWIGERIAAVEARP